MPGSSPFTQLWSFPYIAINFWPVDKVASWQNAKLTKCQVDKMASWQNGKLTKWQVDKMASWQNGKLTKWLCTSVPVQPLDLLKMYKSNKRSSLFSKCATCDEKKVWNVYNRAQCYNTYYVRNLLMFVIPASLSSLDRSLPSKVPFRCSTLG